MAIKNGFFSVDMRPDGTYLILTPPEEMGLPVDPIEVEGYLMRNGVEHEKSMLYDAIRGMTARKEIRLNRNQMLPIDEQADIFIDGDRLNATARFYAPSSKGSVMSYDDIIMTMAKSGIRYGVIESVIRDFLNNRCYCTTIKVAQALMPKNGSDAVVTYHFNTDLSTKPRMNEDGSVDFHHLDNISSVEAGQLLQTVVPAVQGTPGINVAGKPIKPAKVNTYFIRESKNTRISEDGLQLFAKVSGHATFVEGHVFVSDTYEVPGDVDAATGDIVYSGNVEVEGNVITGYRIEAEGDVIVNGIVEGAEIIAGGQIILKRGIQGMGRGVLKAKSNIVSRFIESAVVNAGGYVHADSIMHSQVESNNEITVGGKKGFITGGTIKAAAYVKAKIAGSVMGTATNIEVGTTAHAAELRQLEKEKLELMENIEKVEKVVSFIAKKVRDGERLSDEKYAQFMALSSQKTDMETRIVYLNDRIETLQVTIDNSAASGYILIDDVIYPGCKVTISNISSFIRTETKHCRLVRDGADVRVKGY